MAVGVAVGIGAPGGTAVAVGVVVVVAVAVGVTVAMPTAQPSASTLLVSSVTAPFRASARPPVTLALVFKVMLVSARMLPRKVVVVPTIAELPTCQKTLQGEPPLIKMTDELLAVVRVLPIWNMKTALALP